MKDYTDIIYSPVITEKSALKMQMFIHLKLLKVLLKIKLRKL